MQCASELIDLVNDRLVEQLVAREDRDRRLLMPGPAAKPV